MAEVQTTNTEAGEMTQIFIQFIMMQTQNTAHCLGQMPDPQTGRAYLNIPMARLLIDQLAVIRAKTAGNLTPEEQKIIDSALGDMEQAFEYVAARTEGFHPGESLVVDPASEELPAADAPAPAAAPAETPAPVAAAATPAAEPAPAPVPVPEESRKRFTKSYGA
jgi:DNA replication initiation complex subunit (GINS family)